MLTLLIIIGAILLGIPLIKIFFKLIFAILGITIGLVSLPFLLIGGLIFLAIAIVLGILTYLLPIMFVGGIIFLAYRYMTNRDFY